MVGKAVITIVNDVLNLENYIVGCLCINENSLQEIYAQVTADDFQTTYGRAVFESACQLASNQETIDPVSIMQQSKLHGTEIPQSYLAECMHVTPTTVNASEYAKRLHEIAEGARLADALETISQDLRTGVITIDQGKAMTEEATKKICFSDDGIMSADLALQSCMEELESIRAGTYRPLLTGLTGIDRYFESGMKNGSLYIIGARPGCGKTTLAMNIANSMARANRRVLYITLEMSVEQLTKSRMQIIGEIQSYDLNHPSSRDVSEKISRASLEIQRYPIDFNKSFHLSIPYISRLCSAKKYDAVFIDHLQLVSNAFGKTQYERITDISGNLKGLALSQNIPVICLSQLNRQSADTAPKLHDLRDSGAIEQDADAVLLLHLVDRAEYGETKPSILEVIIGKNRFGSLGSSELNWYMRTGIIEDRFHGNH